MDVRGQQLDLPCDVGQRIRIGGTHVDVGRRLACQAGGAVRTGILMTGEIVVEAWREEQNETVKHDGGQRRSQRASGSESAGHYSDYVTIAP
jgi:hypothetical protein